MRLLLVLLGTLLLQTVPSYAELAEIDAGRGHRIVFLNADKAMYNAKGARKQCARESGHLASATKKALCHFARSSKAAWFRKNKLASRNIPEGFTVYYLTKRGDANKRRICCAATREETVCAANICKEIAPKMCYVKVKRHGKKTKKNRGKESKSER